MNPKIYSTNIDNEFYTDERCHIIEILNQSESNALSIARARVEPKTQTQLHALNGVDEAYYVISGVGEMEIDGKSIGNVTSGDVVFIPKGQSQQITNIGMSDLVFLCICNPRFEADVYENLE